MSSAQYQREYRARNLVRRRSYGRDYMRRYRVDHPDRARESQRNVYAERAAFYDSLKMKPCADCGASYPPFVMDFDHRGDKARDVSKLKYGNPERLLAEIAKCDLVCANCHRLRTLRALKGELPDYLAVIARLEGKDVAA